MISCGFVIGAAPATTRSRRNLSPVYLILGLLGSECAGAGIHGGDEEEKAQMRRQALLQTARRLPAWSPELLAGLPQLSERYVVTPTMRSQYVDDGYALLPGLLSASEVGAYHDVLLGVGVSTAEEQFASHTRSYQLWQKSAAAKRFVLAPRFAQVTRH